MKRLLLPLLAIELATPVHTFIKYKDQYEAKLACDKWAAKGLIFTFEDSERVWRDPEFAYKGYKYKVFTNEGITRVCDFKFVRVKEQFGSVVGTYKYSVNN